MPNPELPPALASITSIIAGANKLRSELPAELVETEDTRRRLNHLDRELWDMIEELEEIIEEDLS